MRANNLDGGLQNTPLIEAAIYDRLPELLMTSCRQFTNAREKDVFLLSALGVLSGCMAGIRGRYHRSELKPHIYVLIIAPPASGKGIAQFAKTLGWPLHEYKKRQAALQNDDDPTIFGGLYIPGNISAAMFMKMLNDYGGKAILFETEIDTIANSLGQDWGDYSANLREAFHHETITSARLSGLSEISIVDPQLAIVLTGTPGQAKKMFPSTENGLVSRLIPYLYSQPPVWQDVKPCMECDNPDEFFKRKGEEVLQMYRFFQAHPAEFTLSDEQWADLNSSFRTYTEDIHETHGREPLSSTYRMGVIMFRICMILTALRKWESRNQASTIVCSQQDYETAKSIVTTGMTHMLTFLEMIPSSDIQQHVSRIDRFYQALPNRFKRVDAVTVGAGLSIPESTVGKYLKILVNKRRLQVSEDYGFYQKPIVE